MFSSLGGGGKPTFPTSYFARFSVTFTVNVPLCPVYDGSYTAQCRRNS